MANPGEKKKPQEKPSESENDSQKQNEKEEGRKKFANLRAKFEKTGLIGMAPSQSFTM